MKSKEISPIKVHVRLRSGKKPVLEIYDKSGGMTDLIEQGKDREELITELLGYIFLKRRGYKDTAVYKEFKEEILSENRKIAMNSIGLDGEKMEESIEKLKSTTKVIKEFMDELKKEGKK